MVERRSTPEKHGRAKALRTRPAIGDAALWQLLRRKRVAGLRFRRRAIVLGWIPDFWCPAAKLALEIDASESEEKRRRDGARDARLASHGIRTLHIRAVDIESAPERVVAEIEAAARDALQDSTG
jgi:very-short-patch-repair endonuclease